MPRSPSYIYISILILHIFIFILFTPTQHKGKYKQMTNNWSLYDAVHGSEGVDIGFSSASKSSHICKSHATMIQ
jgi:hypothetical protein